MSRSRPTLRSFQCQNWSPAASRATLCRRTSLPCGRPEFCADQSHPSQRFASTSCFFKEPSTMVHHSFLHNNSELIQKVDVASNLGLASTHQYSLSNLVGPSKYSLIIIRIDSSTRPLRRVPDEPTFSFVCFFSRRAFHQRSSKVSQKRLPDRT